MLIRNGPVVGSRAASKIQDSNFSTYENETDTDFEDVNRTQPYYQFDYSVDSEGADVNVRYTINYRNFSAVTNEFL